MLRTRCSEVLSRRAWPTPSSRIPGGLRILFDDLKDHGLPCPGGRSVEQVSHGSDGMAVSTYDSSDIGLSHFDLKNHLPALLDFSDEYLFRELYKLTNYVLEKALHVSGGCNGG
jgi:hypothetical protein